MPAACPHCHTQLPQDFLDRLRTDLAPAQEPTRPPSNPLEPRFTLQAASFVTGLKVRSLYTLLCRYRLELDPPTYARQGSNHRLRRLLSPHDLEILMRPQLHHRPFHYTSKHPYPSARRRSVLAA